MYSRCPPKGICFGHLVDQTSDFGAYLVSTGTSLLRNLGPINSEALALPADDCVSFDQMQDLSPVRPDSGEHHPKHSVFPLEPRHSLPFKHPQLLSQSQVLQCQVPSV